MTGFKILAVTAAALLSTTAGHAAGLPYSSLYVFGDSLVDSGNVFIATGGAEASPLAGYSNGRFSNGNNFADYLASDLSASATASLAGGTNFSFGGAQAAPSQGPAQPNTPPNLGQQIDLFDAGALSFSPSSLVLVTIGGNDIRALASRPATAPTTQQTVGALSAGLQRLIGLGAQNILVTGLPDIGQIPATLEFGPAVSAAVSAASAQYNNAFRQATATLAGLTGANIIFWDFAAFQTKLYANPAAYGLPALNTTTACLPTPSPVVPNCTGFVYFDKVHPTTAIHRAIATDLGQTLAYAVPEPASWALLITGFGLAGTALRRRLRVTVSYS